MTAEVFLSAFNGGFSGVLRWPQFDVLWQNLAQDAAGGWYIYAVGEAPPQAPAMAEAMRRFLNESSALLRREHAEDYCGIVYADSLTSPTFVKIYDPHNLGAVCGTSGAPILPGWVLSKLPPVDLSAIRAPASRQRWWQRLRLG